MEVTGDGLTVAAIQRMVAAHARQIDGTQGWAVKTELSRAGIVSTGHHLAIAKGELVH